jgi:MscS family membrane protein
MESDLLYWGYLLVLFAISIAAGAVVGKLLIRIAKALTGRTKTTLDDRLLCAIETPVESFMFIIIFYFGVGLFPHLSAANEIIVKYVWAAIIVVSTYLASEAAGAIIRWYYEEGHKTSRMKIDLTLLPLLRKISKIAIYFIGLTIALGAAGFDITGLLAVTSIAGIVLGLASQETLGNVFAGVALQLDRPFRYGDYIKFTSGEVARVRKIGLRSTVLEDLGHSTIFISNSELAKQRITNLDLPDNELRISFPADVPISADLEKLAQHLQKEISAKKFEGFMSEHPIALSVERVREKSVEISVSYSVRGHPNHARIRDFANRKILEFIGAGRK